MYLYYSLINHHRCQHPQVKCFIHFLLLAFPVFLVIVFVRPYSSVVFQAALFVFSWVSWTFIEYIVHRFWMHGKGNPLYKIAAQRHLHHHKHPQDLKITPWHRLIMFIVVVALIWLSVWFNNYFTLLAGFFTGFAAFCFIHLFLHKKWSRKILSQLVQYHVFHHCKYPEKCHGVSVTWWDKLFATCPPKGAVISPRIIDFYFQEHHH